MDEQQELAIKLEEIFRNLKPIYMSEGRQGSLIRGRITGSQKLDTEMITLMLVITTLVGVDWDFHLQGHNYGALNKKNLYPCRL